MYNKIHIMKIQELRKLIKEELEKELFDLEQQLDIPHKDRYYNSFPKEKHYYNDRETWIKDIRPLPAADDGPNFVKNPEGKLIAYWDDELEQGWIKK